MHKVLLKFIANLAVKRKKQDWERNLIIVIVGTRTRLTMGVEKNISLVHEVSRDVDLRKSLTGFGADVPRLLGPNS